MCGFLQAGSLAQELVIKRLTANGHNKNKITPGLWKYHTRLIQICLVVDNFKVKHVEKEHLEHLKGLLEQN